MATYYYEKDANGKQVLVGTYTPDRDANGVALSTGTYKPVGSGSTVGSGSSSGKTGSTGTKTGTTATGSTGNSQYWQPADTSGNNYSQMVGMSDVHQAALEAAGKSWQDAYKRGDQAAMDAAHQQAESIRAMYGYSGGEDGSQYIVSAPGGNKSDFDYGPAPTHNDQYSATIDAMLKDILNRDKFSYNALEDPLYQQYSQQYQREGQRAMQDTLGQVSARTGGMASSYAVSAAQQANNYYASQMADKIPELYQLAYQMYLDDIDLQVQDLGLLENASDRQYDRYRDTMDDWRKDRDFAYDQFRDDIDDERYKGEWIHQLGREQVTDSQWQQTHDRDIFESDRDYEYDVGLDDKTEAQKRVQDHILSMGGKASELPEDVIKAAGYTPAELAAMERAYAEDKAVQATQSTGTGGGGGGGGGSMDYEGLFAAASKDPYSASSFIANNYKKYGFGSTSGLYDAYEEWAANQGGGDGTIPDYVLSEVQTITNPGDLATYLDEKEQSGVITGQQADELYAKYMNNNPANNGPLSNVLPLSQRMWTVENNGGINGGWGIDNNAVVKDQDGNKYRLDDLIDALVGEGMSKADAKKYVKSLQDLLGI